MIRTIITIAAMLYVLYKCLKNKEAKYLPARLLSYAAIGTCLFGIVGKNYFYHSVFYLVGLICGLLSFFCIGAYFAWQGREDPAKKFAFYLVIGVIIFIALIAIVIASGINNVLFRG